MNCDIFYLKEFIFALMESPAKILIVDDEPDILEFLNYNFTKEGYTVFTASNGVDGITMAQKHQPALILLDVMMPELDGIEVCEQLRSYPKFKDTIIIFLTARKEAYSEIAGFSAGADDFVTKPVRPKVLLARVKAFLRKKESKQSSQNSHIFGDLTINIEKRIVEVNGETIELPKKEFEILSLLSSRPEKIFSRDEIYHKVWGSGIIVGDRTLDVHIRKLRKLIGKNYIKTSKGVGYAFTY